MRDRHDSLARPVPMRPSSSCGTPLTVLEPRVGPGPPCGMTSRTISAPRRGFSAGPLLDGVGAAAVPSVGVGAASGVMGRIGHASSSRYGTAAPSLRAARASAAARIDQLYNIGSLHSSNWSIAWSGPVCARSMYWRSSCCDARRVTLLATDAPDGATRVLTLLCA